MNSVLKQKKPMECFQKYHERKLMFAQETYKVSNHKLSIHFIDNAAPTKFERLLQKLSTRFNYKATPSYFGLFHPLEL